MTEKYDDLYNRSENPTRYIKQRVSDVAPTLDSNDESSEKKNLKTKPGLGTSIVAGGLAAVAVDCSLYPLDTIKTRLQSQEGFKGSGGFRKLYKGIAPVLLCSAPLSALFFGVYNSLIDILRSDNSFLNPLVYLAAAPISELVCATFRVPMEIVKQRKQTSNHGSILIVKKTYREEGLQGFYRGLSSFIMREIPFAAIQYPVWEYMLNYCIYYQAGESLTALQSGFCGAAAGSIAAVLTTPLDVIKTRIMLAEKEKIQLYKSNLTYNFAKEIYHERGIFGFFAGVIPRTLWISLGGFIYFGTYDKVKILWENKFCALRQKVRLLQDLAPSYFEETFIFTFDKTCSEDVKKEKKVEQNVEEGKLLSQEQNVLDTTLLPSETSFSKK